MPQLLDPNFKRAVVLLIHQAGLRAYGEPRRAITLLRPVEVQQGGKWARLLKAPVAD